MKIRVTLFLFIIFQVSCMTRQINLPSLSSGEPLQVCPEELIIDGMPRGGKSDLPNQYYIYQGMRREVKDFDSAWVNKNCQSMKITKVY